MLIRLPTRFGYEACTIHTAELVAMTASLRWRNDAGWNRFVFDRSVFFNALQHASETNSSWPTEGACLFLEGRLRNILQVIKNGWTTPETMPPCKIDQDTSPERWSVKKQLDEHPRPMWMSRIAYNQHGLVCVDVKSHQTNSSYPYPAIAQATESSGDNEAQS